jgi:radical SAM superfamily enzyme with C-terminal helix-hairpin-helix motif
MIMASYEYESSEIYPVYSVWPAPSNVKNFIVELTDEEFARIEAVNEEWEACQKLIESRISAKES